MKNIRLLTLVLLIGTLFLSACGAGAATPTSVPEAAAGAKVQAMPVSFIGIIDSMAGDQWVISGTTVTVNSSIVRDGPFHVGDQVKVEGHVRPDGSFTVARVEAPTPQETATLPSSVDDNSKESLTNGNTNDANSNDGNINDDHGNEANTNDDHSSVNSNDDSSNASNSNDSNTNDDHSGNTNSTDDHGGKGSNDNNSGSDKNSGGDDHGGGNSNDG